MTDNGLELFQVLQNLPKTMTSSFQCRFVFGNNLVPNTLIVHLDDSHVTYTSTPASTVFDEFMHDLKVKSESIRIILVPSDNYTGGIVDEYVNDIMFCIINHVQMPERPV